MQEVAFLKSLALLVIIISSLFGDSNCQQNLFLKKTCGVLHSLDNFLGDELLIKDNEQSVNFAEAGSRVDGGWNTTGSIIVSPGCHMETCNDTYFDGACQSLREGSHTTANLQNLDDFNLNNTIASARCVCQKECKCSDIHMKESSCARAYLKGGCRTCYAPYTDLKGSQKYFPEEFEDKVEALRLRKGCTLSLFSEENFEGDENIIEAEIVEDFQDTFRSYNCQCEPGTWIPKSHPPRPADFPPWVDIPTNADDIIKLLNNMTFANHPGLKAALSSLKQKRSPKNAYILLLGSTGAGKSSAINILFDNPKVTKVGDMDSTTTDIHEFRIPVPVDEFGIANSELRIIDTPGLEDTRGVEQDAKFLATLDAFLSNHEELKDKLPNVILIFHKFMDNRVSGAGAAFVRMLRGLQYFRERIMDENFANVIFVLSHFCSGTKKDKRNPDGRLKNFKMVIENYSLFPRPTILSVAENKAEDQELTMVNGYWKLPNNEYYPRNLFEKMNLVTEKGSDLIGQSVIRTAFRNSEDFNVSSTTFKLLENRDNKVEHFLKILTDVNLDIKNTSISQLLSETWDFHMNATLKKQFPGSLSYLQKSLNIRSVNTMADVPKTTAAILELLTAIKQDPATRALLDKALHIKTPVFPQFTVAGHGYNVFKDSYLLSSPFQLDNLQQSDIGFMIPQVLSCKLERSSSQNFYVFENKNEYIQRRLENLGIEGKIDGARFTGEIKPGYNVKEVSFQNDSCDLSGVREFKTFQLTLNDRPELSKEFVKVVKGLPPFNQTDYEVVKNWTNFFNEYGTHVVRSVYGGGIIKYELSSGEPFSAELVEALVGLMGFEEYSSHMNGNMSAAQINQFVHSVSFQGGDIQYYTRDLTQLSIEEADRLLINWQKSIKFNPTVLLNHMKLLPMSQVVKKLGANYSAEIESATSLLFNSSLMIYVPPKKGKNEPGRSREDTALMTLLLEEQQQTKTRMEAFMMEMKRMQEQNEERRHAVEQQRLAWEQEKVRLDEEFRVAQLAREFEVEEKRRKTNEQLEAQRLQQELDRQERERKHREEMMALIAAMNQPPPHIIYDNYPYPHHPVRPRPSCLKKGTQILMVDNNSKPVQELQVGDTVLDKDMNPTKVLGVAYEFLLDQKFYGFDNNSFFFTDTHMFVGPSSDGGDFKVYAKSTKRLFQNNPLLKYLNVTDMETGEGWLSLFHFDEERRVSVENVELVEDPEEYAADTPIYFIQVDSPTGTYFANGYVCRHEIPPVEYWPNTMSILFKLMGTESFEKLSQLPYTVETVSFLQDVTTKVAENIEQFLESNEWRNPDEKEYEVMTLGDIDLDGCIGKIFSNPTLSTAGVSLYAQAGDIMAPYLDSVEQGRDLVEPSELGRLQHELFQILKCTLYNVQCTNVKCTLKCLKCIFKFKRVFFYR